MIKPSFYAALALLAPLTASTAQQKNPLAPLAPLAPQATALAQNNYGSIVRIEGAGGKRMGEPMEMPGMGVFGYFIEVTKVHSIKIFPPWDLR